MFKTISQRILDEVNVVQAIKEKQEKLPLKLQIKQWFLKQLIAFCGETPLHGFNHTVSEDMFLLER